MPSLDARAAAAAADGEAERQAPLGAVEEVHAFVDGAPLASAAPCA